MSLRQLRPTLEYLKADMSSLVNIAELVDDQTKERSEDELTEITKYVQNNKS